MTTIQELKTFKLFDGFNDDELYRLASLVNERSFAKGVECIRQGSRASELHLCRDGKVNIVVQHFEAPTINIVIHTATKGEVFGWSALVAPYKYTASVICVEKTDEFFLRQADLCHLFEQFPRIGYVFMKNIAAIISSRVTDYSKRLSKDIAIDTRDDYEW